MRCDYAVNEGAGDRVEIGGRVLYLCSSAEKRSAPFTLRVHGRSGHGSMPGIADNALVKAARLIERLGSFEAQPVLTPEMEGFLGGRCRTRSLRPARRSRLPARSTRSRRRWSSRCSAMTVAPTMIQRPRSGT